jgi:hypothetical protein
MNLSIFTPKRRLLLSAFSCALTGHYSRSTPSFDVNREDASASSRTFFTSPPAKIIADNRELALLGRCLGQSLSAPDLVGSAGIKPFVIGSCKRHRYTTLVARF